ncbi:MAG: hypothetical protein HFJ28_05705 [Clostridia bacterium]|jgi:hypothetical protein|nr:hypothetical protein [Clostridia bacterium]
MKLKQNIAKSNKGFTLQDVAIAVIAIMAFAGTIGSIFLSIYQLQADTIIDSSATLYMVQIMERIDKVGYDELTEETMETQIAKMRSDFHIPELFGIALELIPYGEDDLLKTVKLTLTYTPKNEPKSIVVERVKVREL